MYYSQSFKSPVVMDRVCEWLVRLGFRPSEIHASRKHIPSLFISADWARLQLIQKVVDAAVHADPGALGDAWDRPLDGLPAAEPASLPVAASHASHASPIHWEVERFRA